MIALASPLGPHGATPRARGRQRSLWLLVGAVFALGSAACDPPATTSHRPGRDETNSSPAASGADVVEPDEGSTAAGTSCTHTDDCPDAQACVEGRCRHRRTSVAGEILASSASALAAAGDWERAIATYEEATEAFTAAHAPIPPELVCEQAALMLSVARDTDAREAGARRADACFRLSLPGFGPRDEVRRAVARLRFEGLDVSLFDESEPAARFFTQRQSAPTADAIDLEVTLGGDEQPNLEEVRTQLASDDSRRAIADCFIQDWGIRHERTASATLLVRYSARMRDMGSYDTFVPEIAVDGTTPSEDGFEPCLSRALTTALTAPRAGRVTAWQAPLEIHARIR